MIQSSVKVKPRGHTETYMPVLQRKFGEDKREITIVISVILG